MTAFPLKIVTPDGLKYEGPAESLTVRSTSGEIGILAGHINCVAPLGMGRATVVLDGKKRYAACIGGILMVMGGSATLVPTTFEWADQIDLPRAQASYLQAQEILRDQNADSTEIALAQARLRRALIRKSVASGNR